MSTHKALQLRLLTLFPGVAAMILSVLSLIVSGHVSFAQTKPGQEMARLIKRYEQPASQFRVVEDTVEIRLEQDASKRKLVAIRVCSNQPLDFAVFQAAIDPFETARYLKSYYAYPADKIFILRSEQCLGPRDSKTDAAEIWIGSSQESLPQSVESLRFDQVNRTSLGTRPTNRGVRDYQAAVQNLIKRLHSNSESRGVIIGYYLEHPSPELRKRLHEVDRLLKQSDLPPDRYSVMVSQWHEGDSSKSKMEPRFPSVFIIEIIKRTARRQ